ncbi:MAG: class I SAM-dependent methyltransferase [Endomicrobiales bacterium]
MNRRQFFDQCAEQWDDCADTHAHDRSMEVIVPFFKIKKNQSVLDVGTGTGTLLPYLREMTGKRASITGLDFSPRMLEKAREKYGSRFSYVRASADDMPFPTATFDVVVSLNVFPHFSHKLQALKESWRVLKDGGKLIIAHTGSIRHIHAHHKKIGGPVAGDIMPTGEVMRTMLVKAGFVKSKLLAGKTFHFIEAFKPRDGELPSGKSPAIRHVACDKCCHCGGCAGKLL